jgi:hypothetical protein
VPAHIATCFTYPWISARFHEGLVNGLTLRLINTSLSTRVQMVVHIAVWLFLCSVWIKTRNSIMWTTCYCPAKLLSMGIPLQVCSQLFELQESANIDKLLTQNASSCKMYLKRVLSGATRRIHFQFTYDRILLAVSETGSLKYFPIAECISPSDFSRPATLDSVSPTLFDCRHNCHLQNHESTSQSDIDHVAAISRDMIDQMKKFMSKP